MWFKNQTQKNLILVSKMLEEHDAEIKKLNIEMDRLELGLQLMRKKLNKRIYENLTKEGPEEEEESVKSKKRTLLPI